MHSQTRFYLDENIQSAVALGLRIRGIDVLTAQEAGLRGASDLEHLVFATANERVLASMTLISLSLTRAVRSRLFGRGLKQTSRPTMSC